MDANKVDPNTLRAIQQLQQLEQQRRFAKANLELTGTCWDACMGYPGSRLDAKTERCMANCVNRFLDVSNFITNKLEKEGEAILSKSGESSVQFE